jgi:hypothetical protein
MTYGVTRKSIKRVGVYFMIAIMPIEQIIKEDNGDGTGKVTVVSSGGNVGTRDYDDRGCGGTSSSEAQTEAAEEALSKD